ncbi:MAG: glycosyltransferase, partial [Lachnospiraceae bacterium]|nr:glycosyltransferase [Candidatus Colinaster scatohippi]
NHDYVLDIYREYLVKHKEARLLLIGKGAEKERILKKIEDYDLKDRIIFLEGRSDIPELLSAMDIFILPSLFEGYPVSAIEAQAMGLPCILSDRITKECLVTDRVEMVSIDGPAAAWCEAIDRSRAKDNSRCMDKIGNLEDYDIQNSIRRLEDIFCNV